MENPNAYDDDAYVEAANAAPEAVRELVEKLWLAGAAPGDIATEVENALESAFEEAGAGGRVTVHVSVTVS
jgi:hypothetical protein